MEGGARITLSDACKSRKSIDTTSILVVDDDITCLAIVAAILKKFKYEVVTVKHPKDALCTLRIKGGAFDLVVSDVHMPDMNGFQLQQAIAQEFNLPVVLMSADEKESVALKGLESGAAFFILKPVAPDDFKNLWQFAAMKKKSQVVIVDLGVSESSLEKSNSDEKGGASASSQPANEGTVNKKEPKRKSPTKEGSDEKIKKPKVVWTNSLHNQFLEAIRSIGLDRAVPKKILEVMNAPGLTRENVASHLQKYRIFLRRVSDASYKIQHSSEKSLNRNFITSSSFESSPPSGASSSTPILNRFSKLHYQTPPKFPLSPHHFTPIFTNSEATSSTRLITPSPFGQSRLLISDNSVIRPSPNILSPNQIHQNNNGPYVRPMQNNQTSIQGYLSNISLEDIVSGASFSSSIFDASLIGTSSNVPSKNDPTYHTNYVGYSISNIKHLANASVQKYDVLNLRGDTISMPGDEFQRNINTTVEAPAVPNESTMNLYDPLIMAQLVGVSSSSLVDGNYGSSGQVLSGAVADYGMVVPPNPPSICGMENGGDQINHHDLSALMSPMFDLSELGIMPNQQSTEELGDLEAALVDGQVSSQNQEQQNRGETIISSNFYVGNGMRSQWENDLPSLDQVLNQQHYSQGLAESQEFGTSSQLNQTVLPLPNQQQVMTEGLTDSKEFSKYSHQLSKTILSPTERDDDDFLESLLAPFEENETTLEGI